MDADIRYAGCGYRVFIGVFCGLGMAILYSGIGLVALVSGGGSSLERAGISLVELLLLYLIAGVVAGLVLGFVWPLARFRWGAALVGFIVASVVYNLAFLTIDPGAFGEGGVRPVVFSFVVAAITGMPLGLYFWVEPEER